MAATTRFSDDDRRFMRLALRLAERGRGGTHPNPVVGAVLVSRAGRIIARGFHRRAGGQHAEAAALSAPGLRARGATLYVSLEPCCHSGRTGPCTELIIKAGVARVIVGCGDANPMVDGRGIARLRRAGLRVDVGCLETECRATNRAFFTWIAQGRPRVTLKAAASLDGFIAAADGSSRWITGPRARRVAHELRAAHDAVLVGAGTILADDSRLTVRLRRRHPGGASGTLGGAPLRVVLDGRLRTPPSARVLRRPPDPPALIVGARGASERRARALRAAGADVVLLPARGGRVPVRTLLKELAHREVQSLLVEGGAAVHGAFIDARVVDSVALFVAPRLLGRGRPVAAGAGSSLARSLTLAGLRSRSVGDDILLIADNVHGNHRDDRPRADATAVRRPRAAARRGG